MKALQNNAEVIMIERRIPFSPPDISDLEIQEVVQTLNSGWITTGPKTKQLEKNISLIWLEHKAAVA